MSNDAKLISLFKRMREAQIARGKISPWDARAAQVKEEAERLEAMTDAALAEYYNKPKPEQKPLFPVS